MPNYKLTRRFYGEGRLWPVGTVLSFIEGQQPRTAKRVKDNLIPAANVSVVDPTDEEDWTSEEVLLDAPTADVVDVAEPGDTLASLSKKGK